jgi:hypothetical protein
MRENPSRKDYFRLLGEEKVFSYGFVKGSE